ncbi:nucleotidyl transferase AbiEii/AbiGii toxin family protein [Streptococcus raffinosi]|uniref:Nucleotidyl transferase AbiEii/AbiGii toxin family protein n=1 Tax=Streptococcus raffinosi TaxID=3053355 RepID=A0ABT7LSI1_9STRE|nr:MULTISPECIES: nucleotidyl transferase AbiEii/AbiGii toxin family protein [unclassified Streptococcus]MDL5042985.1 nucleotidyl transferase AbiEii/AbiGii toxin family protein [Streptococcus sp. VTCC 12812]MDM0093977.1 nucleotidyl transferase AbiEii/AbiGii toxin family protein [Streptococcus sp. VTCC 12813]
MNKTTLTLLCHKISKQTGLTFNSVMTYYFLEMILKKLSQSSYSRNYIFKGGFLLSNVIGVESRSTVDIDFLFQNITLSFENVEKQLKDILAIPIEGINFTLQSIASIKESDLYSGYRASILCQLENIKQMVHLDIATGDIVTPHPIHYDYKSLFEDDHFPIIAYLIETIIAEKLQTIYSRNFLNSRSKDFYDIYILSKLKREEIDTLQLQLAIKRTFASRGTTFNYNKNIELLKSFKNDETQNQQWQNYARKYSYTNGISFKEVLDEIIMLLTQLPFSRD